MTGHRWTLHDVLCVACKEADDITCDACGRCQDCAEQLCERTRYVLTAEGAATLRRMMAEPEHPPEQTRYSVVDAGSALDGRVIRELPATRRRGAVVILEHLPATRRICTTCHGQRMTVGERGPKVCDACNGDGVEVLP